MSLRRARRREISAAVTAHVRSRRHGHATPSAWNTAEQTLVLEHPSDRGDVEDHPEERDDDGDLDSDEKADK
jgi:hypothetical protein